MKRAEPKLSSDTQRNPSVAKRSGLSGSLYYGGVAVKE